MCEALEGWTGKDPPSGESSLGLSDVRTQLKFDERVIVTNPVLRSVRLLTGREKKIFFLMLAGRVFVQGLDVLGLIAIGALAAILANDFALAHSSMFLGLELPVLEPDGYVYGSAIIGAFFVTKSVLGAVFLRLTTRFLASIESRAALEVARYLFLGPLERLKKQSEGDIQWSVSSSPNIAFAGVLLSFSTIVAEGALFLFIMVTLALVDFGTAVAVLVYFVAIVFSFQRAISQRTRRLGQRIARESVTAINLILSLSRAYKELSVAGRKSHFLGKFGTSRSSVARDFGLQRFVMGLPRYYIEAALITGIVSLIIWNFLRGSLAESVVSIGMLLAAGTRLLAAVLPFQNAISELRIAAPKAERAQALIEEARDFFPPHRAESETATSSAAPMSWDLEVKDLSFRFADSTKNLLERVNFKVHAGRVLALVGPSGAGKTTLADLLLGLYEPLEGEILLGGMPPDQLRRISRGSIAYVPQHPGVVAGTWAENVALGRDSAEISESRVESCLDAAGLLSHVLGQEGGVSAQIRRRGSALSGGQIQRLGIARALYDNPKLLVLDEATSALDAEAEAHVMDFLAGLRGTLTTVIIAHRISTVQDADTVIVLNRGKVEGSGTFQEVRRKVPMIENYVRLMSVDPPRRGEDP